MPGRKQIFEDCLARFSFDRQLEIIAELTGAVNKIPRR
jgi:hypothetical protein